jgi:hypothetical protein
VHGDDIGVAWDVSGEMARDKTRPQVVLAAGTEADEELHGLSAIKVGGGLGDCGTRDSDKDQRRPKASDDSVHVN